MKNYKINNTQFHELVRQGYHVVDVRAHGEAKMTGKVYQPAINIPYPNVINDAQRWFPDLNTGIIFICNYGNRSGIAAASFQQKGYKNAFVLATGLFGLD